MNIKTNETDTAVIIKLEGEMMLGYEANDFHETIRSAIEKGKINIVVDLSEVKFITSWGIGILIYAYTTTTNAGGKFKLASIPKIVKDTFNKVKIDSIFPQYESVDSALKD